MPHWFGSSGGQVGTGHALVLAVTTAFCWEALAICEEAAAPVRTRAMAKMRAKVFIVGTFLGTSFVVGLKFCCTKQLW